MTTTQPRSENLCGTDLLCELTKTLVDGEDQMSYTTYGIIIKREDEPVLSIADISTDRDFVERFLLLLESRNVSLVHVREVLEDYLQ